MRRTMGWIHTLLVSGFFLLVLYLWVLAGFSTSMMDANERTFLVGDSMALNLLSALVFLSLCLFSAWALRRLWEKKGTGERDAQMERMSRIVLWTIGCLGALFVLATQRESRADQLFVQEVVDQWRMGDFSSFEKGGYLDQYPHQAGFILILYLFSFLFGTYNDLALQLANVAALVVICRELGDMAGERTGRCEVRLAVCLFCLFFFPGILYTTFVYGNLMGLALSLLAFRYAARFLESGRLRHGCAAFLLLLMAVILKQNYLIFGIALVLWILMGLIRKNRVRTAAFAASLVLAMLAASFLINGAVSLVTGHRPGRGLSRWSWVTMGVMESDVLYDGWWNHYNYDTYVTSGFDTDRQEAVNKADLAGRLKTFRDHPRYALRFFVGKNASQWNQPGFEGVWINRIMPENKRMREAAWADAIIRDDGTGPLSRFMNRYHFIILLGVLIHVCSGGLKRNPHEMFYGLAFIGGFLFYTVWEAKGQYTLSCFWLLLPMSAEGYAELIRGILTRAGTGKGFRKPSPRKLILSGVALLVSAVLFWTNPSLFRDLFLRDEDTEAYAAYLSEIEP